MVLHRQKFLFYNHPDKLFYIFVNFIHTFQYVNFNFFFVADYNKYEGDSNPDSPYRIKLTWFFFW